MHNHIFEKFEEVEESLKQFAPKTVYKYRADWNNVFHKSFITEQTMWFAAPRELNDLYDIRIPVRFDVTEVEHPLFFLKLKKVIKAKNLALNERDLNVICENKMEEIRRDPKSYFENTYRAIREEDIYDCVGLFSCTTDELNETMWAHYGNNHTGFVVGFNTVELCRNLFCSAGPVKYSDEIPFHSFIDRKSDDDFSDYFLKSKKWEYEKEYRFFILGDDSTINRIKKYPVESVNEFLLGAKFPNTKKTEFINEVRKIFTKETSIYQVKPKVSGFGLEKTRID